MEDTLLPAFQDQVLICTSDSGSNPERAVYIYTFVGWKW